MYVCTQICTITNYVEYENKHLYNYITYVATVAVEICNLKEMIGQKP